MQYTVCSKKVFPKFFFVIFLAIAGNFQVKLYYLFMYWWTTPNADQAWEQWDSRIWGLSHSLTPGVRTKDHPDKRPSPSSKFCSVLCWSLFCAPKNGEKFQ